LIANPRSGKGRGASAAEAAVAALRTAGAELEVHMGASAADTRRLVGVALAGHPDAIVVVGGDGTVSEILPELTATQVPMVLVPAGTGNDVARALGLPRRDPAGAALLAMHGVRRRIDVGEIEADGRITPFLTVAALGFDAKVSDRTNRLRWPHGAPRYYLALLIELARLRPMLFTLSIDAEPPRIAPGTLIAVGSTSSYGGGMPVCAGALPDDGLLDVVHVAPLGRMRLLRLFPLMLRGRHLARPEVLHRRARTVTVSAPGLVVYADGERTGEDECTISLLPAAITLMVPKESHD